MMSDANIAFVQSLYAAFQRGDVGTIAGTAVPDTVWQAHGQPKDHPAIGVYKGPQGVQKFFGIVAETEDVSAFAPRDFYAAGDKVFVRGHYAWTMRKTGKAVSCGGVGSPPSMPAIVGISVSSRKRSQLSCDSWTATIVQPSADGPATWKSCPSGRPPSLGWTTAIDTSYCSFVPPGKLCTIP
jgi:ketosteroid isomerase-like protein